MLDDVIFELCENFQIARSHFFTLPAEFFDEGYLVVYRGYGDERRGGSRTGESRGDMGCCCVDDEGWGGGIARDESLYAEEGFSFRTFYSSHETPRNRAFQER